MLPASNGHKFILVAIDHFTKWVEAASYATLTIVQVAHFIKQNLIYRYGVPQRGKATEVFEDFKIQVHKSMVYHLQSMRSKQLIRLLRRFSKRP